jgi:hypothetical protein
MLLDKCRQSKLDINFANVKAAVDTAGIVTINAQPNITSVGTLTALSVTGNITGNYFVGNGSQLTGIVLSYGNSNVATFMANFGSNTISTTGNISGGYFFGNGSQLTGLPATYTNANVATFMANFGSNTISTTGNISGGYFFGNGSQLTGLPATYTNANVATFMANFGSNTISTTGNISGARLYAVDGVVFNSKTITAGFTLDGFNAESVGPIDLASGVEIDIIDGDWLIS